MGKKKLDDKFKHDEGEFKKEGEKIAGDYEASMKKNAKEKKDEEEKLAKEAKHNHDESEAEKKKIEADDKKKVDAQKAVDARNKKEDKEKEEEESKRHKGENKKIHDELAHKMQEDADAADAKEKKYAADMKKEDQERDDEAAAQADEDAEMKSCAMDGSECELDASPDSKHDTASCEKTIGHGGKVYYLADDMITCTKKKPAGGIVGSDEEGNNALDDWVHLGTPAPTPAETDSGACTKAKAAFAKGPVAKLAAGGPEAIACSDKLSADEQKAGLEAFMHVGSLCPAHCDDDEDVHDTDANGDTTTQKLCITKDDIKLFRQQIESMPVYKNMGTNGRFKAGPKADVCRMVKNLQAGWNAGKAITGMTF